MREYTPENSIHEEDVEDADGGADGDDEDENRESSHTRLLLRAANSVLHVVTCALLLSIMAKFLHDTGIRGLWIRTMSPEAVVLVVVISIDMILDAGFLIRLHWKWPAWALLLRLVLAFEYLAVFLVYVGLGRAFPRRFTYWGIDADYAGPVLYLFLWLLGVWNLVHTAIHRRRLGTGVRRYVTWLTRGRITPPPLRRRRDDLWTRRRAVRRRRERAAREAGLENNDRTGNRRPPDEDVISLQERTAVGEDKTMSTNASLNAPTSPAVEDPEAVRRPPAAQVRS